MKKNNIQWIIVHGEGAPAIVKDDAKRYDIVDNYHASLGWGGIAYHAFIERDGELRIGRLDDEIGSHTVGYNDRSWSVCLAGASDIQYATEAQIKRLKEVIERKMTQYNVPPEKVRPHRYFATYTMLGQAYRKNTSGYETIDGCHPYKVCYGSLYGDSWIKEIMGFKTSLTKDVKLGDTSDEVKVLQAFLRKIGLFTYPENTGYYGIITAKAVYDFKKKYVLNAFEGLFATGNSIDSRTRLAINNFFRA